MATREELKQVFANGQMATGEKFANLIDSMKVVQLPVVDPQALGTSLSFIDSISQDADGKITATKKTLDLSNVHELNPFKGWWKTGDTLPTSGFDGAYLYFKDTTQTPAVTTIYQWNGTTYADTGTVVDESNVQTFGSGQAVNAVKIKDENGDEVTGTAGVLSAEAGSNLNNRTDRVEEDLYGERTTETLTSAYTTTNNTYMSAVSGNTGKFTPSNTVNMKVVFYAITVGSDLIIDVPKTGNNASYVLAYTDRTGDDLLNNEVFPIDNQIGGQTGTVDYHYEIEGALNHQYLAICYITDDGVPTVKETVRDGRSTFVKQTELLPLQEAIAVNAGDIADVDEKVGGLTNGELISKNIYQGDTTSGYVSNNGSLSPTSPYVASGYIPVIAGHYYYVKREVISGKANASIRVVDANKANPQRVLIALTGEPYTTNTYYQPNEEGTDSIYSSQIKIPEGGAFIQFNMWFSSTAATEEQLATVKQCMVVDLGTEYIPNYPAPEYEPYNPHCELREESLPANVKEGLDAAMENIPQTKDVVLEPATIVNGYIYGLASSPNDWGKIQKNDTYHTNIYKIEAGKKYTIHIPNNGSAANFCWLYFDTTRQYVANSGVYTLVPVNHAYYSGGLSNADIGNNAEYNYTINSALDYPYIAVSYKVSEGEPTVKEIGAQVLNVVKTTDYDYRGEEKEQARENIAALGKSDIGIKVLQIGSSHGANSFGQWPIMAHAAGVDVVAGNLYAGGGTNEQLVWWAGFCQDNTNFSRVNYGEFRDGKWWHDFPNTMEGILTAHKWDVIQVMRNASRCYKVWSNDEKAALETIVNYITAKCPWGPKIVFMSGFADADHYGQYVDRSNNDAIVSTNTGLTLEEAIWECAQYPKEQFGLEINPMQPIIRMCREDSELAALGTSTVVTPPLLCYDNQHLDLGIGMYVAGCCSYNFFMRMLHKNVLANKKVPTNAEMVEWNTAITFTSNPADKYTDPTNYAAKIRRMVNAWFAENYW